MHVHKPKPFHGLREVLGEIGIIVVGIVIAIGLEQAVEGLHWAGEVRAARASLASEISRSNRVFAYRVAAERCIDRRLDALEAIIEQVAKHEPVPHLGQVMPDIGNALNDNIWQSHRAAQTLTHFDEKELELLGFYYQQVNSVRSFESNEVDALGVLKVLQGDPSRLGPADIAGLRVAIQHARFDNTLTASIAADELDYSKQLHITPPPPNAGRLKEVCSPPVLS